MIYVDLPIGTDTGWGICGKYIAKELLELDDICLVQGPEMLQSLDELDRFNFKTKLIPPESMHLLRSGQILKTGHPLLQMVPYAFPTSGVIWSEIKVKGIPSVGYVFFEGAFFDPVYVRYMRENWDVVVAGCAWGEEALKQHGITNATHIIQGVDADFFHPGYAKKALFRDRFVIFSGGKFELRKGQDVAIKAYKIFQDKYSDVMLVNAWYNKWPQSIATMACSPHIRFELKSQEFNAETINHLLAINGIDLNRVITISRISNLMAARVYQNTDVGLFTNRSEGGTNLVLMEYMACGKPAIVSNNSGHVDILTTENSLRIETFRSNPVRGSDGSLAAIWQEPDLDETVAHMEWAYHHRESLPNIGLQAAYDMSEKTWSKTAVAFYDLLTA